MDLPKRKLSIKAFITFTWTLNYCPLIWMLHRRTLNNRNNNIHKRALRPRYEDKESSFKINESRYKPCRVTPHFQFY